MLDLAILSTLLSSPTTKLLTAGRSPMADQVSGAVAAMIAAAHADRVAHSPMWTVSGPGVCVSRSMSREDHARRLAARLDAEHGAGTHTVTRPEGK